jgi:putative ATP-dependent endonuclease of the OLD family
MRLKALKLKNFRGYRGDVTITFDDLTALIGRNDVGKSSVIDALGTFFDPKLVKYDSSDLCVHARDSEVRIGCVFSDLPKALVLDANAETSLSDEYLLNEDGDLEICRSWLVANGRKTESVFAVASHPTETNVDDLLLKKNSELKNLARELNVDLGGVDLRSNPALRKAIWASRPNLLLREVEVPLSKKEGDAKKVWEKIQQELPTFALFRADRPSTDEDSEVQDPMKLAVKEALRSVEDELDHIKKQVREKALDVAKRTLEKLKDIAPDLANELEPTFRNEPKWDSIFKLALTGDDQIPINKRGSGVRRLILLSFFRAEAERRRQEENRLNIIYAIEEPETSQHPKNQRLLVEGLLDLAAEDGVQVVITTHVPALAGLVPVAGIRHITLQDDGARSVEVGNDRTLIQIADELGVLPDERVRVIVCLEGPNDVVFLRNIADVLREEDPSTVDLRVDPRVVVLPLGGSTLQDWVNKQYLKPLGKPEIHIYDRDVDQPPKYQESCDQVNARNDGSQAFLTNKREMENYLHSEAVKESTAVEVEVDDQSDLPEAVAKARHAARYPDREWTSLSERNQKKCISFAKRLLNDSAAKAMKLELLFERGGKDEISEWLAAISQHLE